MQRSLEAVEAPWFLVLVLLLLSLGVVPRMRLVVVYAALVFKEEKLTDLVMVEWSNAPEKNGPPSTTEAPP